jgi:sporulation protein YlmC with PRC-barrel domain
MLKKLMITTALIGMTIGTAAAQSTNPSSGAQQSNPPTMNKQETSPPPVSQQSSPPRPDMKSSATTSAPKFISAQKSDQWLASRFKGTEVLGSDNQKIGSVSDILFDKGGKIEAFIVSVGGFLGIGSKDVALSPDSFQVVSGDKSKNESDRLKISMSTDQLKSAANFEPYNPPRSTTGSGSTTTRPSPMPPVAK